MSAALQRMPSKWRPGLRTVLASLILTVLLLPVGGLVFFRIFEAHLVRETEGEMIGQAALVAEMFKAAVRNATPDPRSFGRTIQPSKVSESFVSGSVPQTDLRTGAILPSRPDGHPTAMAPNLVASTAAETLAPILVEAQKVTLVGLRLLDHTGIVVGGGGEAGLSFAHVEEVAGGLEGRYTAVLRERIPWTPAPSFTSLSRGGTVRVFSVYPVVEGDRLWGLVYQSRTPDNILRKLHAYRDRLLLASLSVLGLALSLALIAGRTISGPINALNERARRLAAGDVAALAPLDQAGTREVAALTDSFTAMASALQHRAAYVRDFAAHVSHEFRTPLTSIQGAAELIAEHGATMPVADRARFAKNILDDTDRLRRLVERLHDLARAEHAASFRAAIDLTAALEARAEAHSTASLKVDVATVEGLVATCSRESLDIVLDNLIANAVQSGATAVRLAAAEDGETVALTVSDNGSGIAAADAPRVFEPFFTTRAEHGGTGLGLRIVRAMIETYGGTIDLVPGETGATFRIRLRRAALQ